MKIFDIETTKDSQIMITGIPYDGATSDKPGARYGPAAVVHESNYQEFYSSYQNISLDDDAQKTFSYQSISSNLNINNMMAEIENTTDEVLINNQIPVTIGGDHSITYPIIKSLCKKYPNIKVLQFDAHTDLREEFEGSEFSHASVMMNVARCIGPNNIKQFGIRSGMKEEFEFMQKHNTLLKSMDDLKEFLTYNHSPLYITIDLDVFDNLVGTGTAVPGGITFHQFIEFVKAIPEHINIIGFDIVELAPNLDPSGYSTTVATLCLKELLLKLRQY